MARRPFGGTTADATLDVSGDVVEGATLTVWTDQTGGTQLTDLQTPAGVALTDGEVTSGTGGVIQFLGPDDGTDAVWVDGGLGFRTLMVATDLTDRLADLEEGTSAERYGALADRRSVTDAAMTSGSATLTSASAAFTSSDVGKYVSVYGAGAGGAPLYGTITARTDATTVTVSASASTTVSSKTAWFATDDSAAIQAAIDAVNAAGGGVVRLRDGEDYLGNVTLKAKVTLAGGGLGTKLRAVPGSSTPVIGSPTDGATFLYEAAVRDLTVHGHKDLGVTGDGIFLAPNHQNTNDLYALNGYWEPNFRITDVQVLYAGRDGVRLDAAATSGAGSSRAGGDTLTNVNVQGSGRYGFHVRRYDVIFTACTAGLSAQSGFRIDAANVRLTGCKGWYSGNNVYPYADPRATVSTVSAGFYIATAVTGVQMTGCESQDNYGYGVHIFGTASSNTVRAHMSGGDSVSGLFLSGGAVSNTVELMVVKADNPPGLYGVLVDGASTTANRVRCDFGKYADSFTGTGNQPLKLQNGALASQNVVQLGYADALTVWGSTTGTVSFYAWSGSRHHITLGGNITVAATPSGHAEPGQRLAVVVRQDATGNRTVTWDATFLGAPALAGAGLTANKTSSFEFVNVSNTDTPSWVYCGGSQGM